MPIKKMHTALGHKILHEMLAIPTAPFAEHLVIGYIERFCARRKNVTLTRDSAGNVLVRVRQGERRVVRPVCMTAHLDHPGFVVDRMIGKRRLRAFWRGGVPPEYFVGTGVRFYVDNGWVRGRIQAIKTVTRMKKRRVDTAGIDVSREVPLGSIGMWDLPEARVRGTRIHARACDDITGAAAMLCCIDRLVRRRLSCDAYFLFTRAEEVGFMGAIAAARLKTIPRKCVVVVIENSSELIHAKMGDGPILRVGDRASVFTPGATAHCDAIARDLAKADRRFKYQRRLMDGGMCESTAYCQFGYDATGICFALGNYHNVDRKRKRIAHEYIDLNDFANAIKWFVELARGARPYTSCDKAVQAQLAEVERTYGPLLRASLR